MFTLSKRYLLYRIAWIKSFTGNMYIKIFNSKSNVAFYPDTQEKECTWKINKIAA